MTTRAFSAFEVQLLERWFAARGRFRDRLFLVLSVATGYRVSELLTLRFRQILSSDGEVAAEITIPRKELKGGHGRHAKGIRSRRIPLHPTARAAIADYIVALGAPPAGDTFVFRSAKGANQPLRRCQAHHILKTATQAAGLDAARLGCHSSRKLFARNVYAASGNDLIKTQRLMSHSSPITTARYLETSDAELDAIVLGVDPMAAPFPQIRPAVAAVV